MTSKAQELLSGWTAEEREELLIALEQGREDAFNNRRAQRPAFPQRDERKEAILRLAALKEHLRPLVARAVEIHSMLPTIAPDRRGTLQDELRDLYTNDHRNRPAGQNINQLTRECAKAQHAIEGGDFRAHELEVSFGTRKPFAVEIVLSEDLPMLRYVVDYGGTMIRTVDEATCEGVSEQC